MATPTCPKCGNADGDTIIGYVVNDWIRSWGCEACGHQWPRDFGRR